MTIEYTYPEEKPNGATVRRSPKTRELSFELDSYGEVIWLNHQLFSGAFDPADVPEVCEAMMRLAGHEWPDAVAEAGKRIIARLEGQRGPGAANREFAAQYAQMIVREECGLQ